MSSHMDSAYDRDEALDYESEVAENADRDDDLARIVSWRGDVESEAAGIRPVEDYVPASGLWYGADVIARATSKAPAGGARSADGRRPHVPPSESSPDGRSVPPPPSPGGASLPGSHRPGAEDEPKDEAA